MIYKQELRKLASKAWWKRIDEQFGTCKSFTSIFYVLALVSSWNISGRLMGHRCTIVEYLTPENEKSRNTVIRKKIECPRPSESGKL